MKRFLVSAILACLLLAQTNAQVNSQDSLALINIYNTTNGAAWMQKWIRTQPVNTWFGVTIAAGRVTGLSLPGNNLSGTLLSSNILKLVQLKTLQLQNNHLTGNVPAGIGSLTDLEQLDLSSNSFSGTLPATFFNSLTKLTHLNVAGNTISGWIPSSIGSAAALIEINIANNAFSNKIPTGINSINNLTKFLAANNQLIGPVPMGKLCSSTVQVNLRGNRFTFTGMECLVANPNAIYNDQQELNLAQNGVILSVSAGGKQSDNTYTWYRYDTQAPFVVAKGNNQLGVTKNGDYWAVVTNDLVPGLSLRTDTVSFTQFESLKTDSLALVEFYNSTNGANWTQKWNLNTPVSTWIGVTVSFSDGQNRVTSLIIPPDNNVVGVFPFALTTLTELRILEITGAGSNQVVGNIPVAIRNLSKLTHLKLQDNRFISADLQTTVSGLYSLVELDLSNNSMRNYVPTLIGLKNLQKINLSSNFLEGEIPAWEYSILKELREIDFSNNNLVGDIPGAWITLNKLTKLKLSNNRLTGSISDLIGTIPSLQTIELNNNQLSGYISIGLCQKNAGAYIDISSNKFTFEGMECFNGRPHTIKYGPQATIPLVNNNSILKISAGGTAANNTYRWYKDNVLISTKIGDPTYAVVAAGNYHAIVTNSLATALTLYSDTITVNSNGSLLTDSLALVDFYNGITSGLNWVLTDPVSTWEGVTVLDGRVKGLTVGGLSGTLSPSIGNLTALRGLYIDEGNLTGGLPSTIANWTGLWDINIFKNNLTGSIPDDLGLNQPEFGHLLIADNPLTGNIPSGLQYATNLTELYLMNTQITGQIPSFFKKLPLYDLNLSGNKLTGPIPDTLSNQEFGFSTGLDLHNNQLTGSIPRWLEGKVLALDLSYNKLSGTIPGIYGAWCKLNNNRFTGVIPAAISGTNELDLSNNLLEALAPTTCIDHPNLAGINFSGNKLNFTSLECLTANPNLGDAVISPQQRLPIINTNPVLKAAAGGTLANNTYKWYKNTGYFTTKTGDSTLTITTPGVYHCIVTNSTVPGVELRTNNANISTVSSRKIRPGKTTDGNLVLGTSSRLSVYPNPTGSDVIYIKGLQKAESVLLYNATGQLVKQWQNVNGNQQLNIGSITNGMYMVKVVEKDKQTMLKFIKQ